MPDTLEETTSPWHTPALQCSHCAREIHDTPEYCFICRQPLCRLTHCSSGYMIPGLVQLQSLCPHHRKQWPKYYAVLEKIEADKSKERVTALREWIEDK